MSPCPLRTRCAPRWFIHSYVHSYGECFSNTRCGCALQAEPWGSSGQLVNLLSLSHRLALPASLPAEEVFLEPRPACTFPSLREVTAAVAHRPAHTHAGYRREVSPLSFTFFSLFYAHTSICTARLPSELFEMAVWPETFTMLNVDYPLQFGCMTTVSEDPRT